MLDMSQFKEAVTYSHPVGNQVTFIDDQDYLLVRLFFLDIVKDGVAHCAKGITGVKYMQDDVGGVDDLV